MLNFLPRAAVVVLATLCITVGGSGAVPAATDASLSFAQAWQRVVAENDAIKAARAKVDQAEHAEEASRALNLPDVSLSASYIYLDDDVELSPSDIFDSMEAGDQAAMIAAGFAHSMGLNPAQLEKGLTSTIAERENLSSSLRATWPLYAGGRIAAAQTISSEQVKEARHDMALERLSQFEHLVRYYFGAVLARQVVKTRMEVEAGLKTHRDHAVLLEREGQIARVERMQSEAAYDKAVVERRKAERDLEIAEVALTRMLRSEQRVVPSDTLFVADSLPPIRELIDATLSGYPGLDVLRAKKQQADGLAAIEKGKYLPTVALFGNASLYEEDDLLNELTPDWFVGVGVSVPLVDRSGRAGRLEAARSAASRIDHLQQQVRSDLAVLVEKTYRQALQALEEFEGLRSSRSLAEETVRLRIKAFNQGLGTSLDVVDAELFLAGVKTQRAVAVYNYVVALGNLYMVSGRPETFMSSQNTRGIEER